MHEPQRLIAKVAPYIDAINTHRDLGYTWQELADIFDSPPLVSFKYAVKYGTKYNAEQLPLPASPHRRKGEEHGTT